MVWSGTFRLLGRGDLEVVDLMVTTKYLPEKYVRVEEVGYSVFRVTPHSSNLNSSSRKFQSSIYELFSYQHPVYPWQREGAVGVFNKDNLYLSLREKPRFFWIIRMYGYEGVNSNGEKDCMQKIEFYMAVPTDFREAFKTKFRNHEQWKRSTLEELEEEFIFPPDDDTDMYSLRYTRNDMFSLEFDYTQQNTPIRDIMTVSRELGIGESVYLFIQTESVSRRKWRALVDYAWSVWDRGGVPSRPGFNPRLLAQDVANLGVRGFFEVKDIIDDVLAGVRSAFFNDKEPKKAKERPVILNPERQALLVNGDLSKRTKNKRNLPVFKTNIIYTVTSSDPVRRDMLARSMATAFSDLNGDNTLKAVKVSTVKRDLESLRQWKIRSLFPNLMSVDEVGKLEQLPTADLQKEFEDSLESNRRVEIEVHEELLDKRGILAGTVTNRGEVHEVHVQTRNWDITSTARVFIGSPRMGKDQAAINYVVEAKRKHNIGAVVLDVINEQNGHRGMADAIRDHLEPEDVIDLNLMDFQNPIYLGLEPIVKLIKDPRVAADRVAEELCAFLLQDGDEDKLQTADHLREASKLTNADILAIRYLFTSASFRNKLLKERGHLFDTDIWDQYNKMSEGRQQAIYTPIMRRIGQIMNSEFLKPIFCQRPNPNLDLFRLIEEGKVIIFRMKTGLMSTRVIEILCHWIVLVAFMVKLAQGGNMEKSNGTILVLNEPHQYLTDGLAHLIERIFAEGPKYRFVPLLIFHNFKQFKKFPGFVDMMKSASLNWHIFKNTNEDVYKELFGYLSRTFETPLQAFEATKRFQYIGVWLSSEGEYYDPFVADTLPLVGTRYPTKDNSYLTLQHSKLYGRNINEVLEEIKQRTKEARDTNEEEKFKSKK